MIWVNVTTADRFFVDVAEAAEKVIEKVQRGAVARRSRSPTLGTTQVTRSLLRRRPAL